MAKTKKLCTSAAVAAAVFFACGVQAIDWPAAGGTYTVPADTTVEVGQDDFAAVTALEKVILANSNSVMRFTTSTYPSGPSFEGSGTVVFAEELAAGTAINFKRSLADAGSGNFVKFDFVGGVDINGAEGTMSFDPGIFTNATVYYHGANSPAVWQLNYNGRFDFDDDFSLSRIINIGGSESENSLGVVRQRGGSVEIVGSNDPIFGRPTGCAAYLLEGGTLWVHPKNNRWYAYGRYIHFRQTGGEFKTGCWQRPENQNDKYTIPTDFIYGGTAVASAPLEDSTPMFSGPMNVIMMGNARVYAMNMPAKVGCGYWRMAVLNGGLLEMDTRASSNRSPVYYSFNGGTLRAGSSGSTVFGNPVNTAKDIIGSVRVYERGGTAQLFARSTSDAGSYCYMPDIREPEGNIVKSVEITSELASRVWQAPPSVEISDSTGAGSNALAIVDYDFDSGKVTNITVVSGGENYTDGKTTANLRYKAGEALLETSLPCTVGPCQGGDFEFCATNQGAFRVYSTTNTYHGATIVNTDMSGEADHKTTGSAYKRTIYIYGTTSPRFLNSTSIVVKSGCLWPQSASGSPKTIFPSCTRLELYGGHLAQQTFEFNDVVIGGETWLQTHAANYDSVLKIPADGTLSVAYGAVATNDVIVTPKLKFGTVTFVSGAKITLKGWEKLPRGKRLPILDLSEVSTFTTRDNATLLQPENGEGVIAWGEGDDAKILYARRRADGFFLLFR